MDKPDLLAQVTEGLTLQERHLLYVELMIMEQVADWEIGTGRTEQESSKSVVPQPELNVFS